MPEKERSTTQAAAADSEVTTQQEEELLPLGTKILCSPSFDEQSRAAEVIERRTCGGVLEIYVHYLDCDRRLDEWIPASRASLLDPAAIRSELISPMSGVKADGCTPTGGAQKMTRRLKRRFEEVNHVQTVEDLTPIDQTLEREHTERTKVKNINVLELGKHEMDTWYYSPFPAPYCDHEKLYACEYCLKYFRKEKTLCKHQGRCPLRAPPGRQIYSSPVGMVVGGPVTDPQIAMYEVDGAEQKVYCQNLCLVSKLFLDHKTLYFDVEHFLFYVMCEVDEEGSHVVGYFSKEKHSSEDYNLACILTLPSHQRKGYGRFLIAFSYALSSMEGKVGSPERPLSDLGAVSYRSYWTRVVLECLKIHGLTLSLRDISRITSIREEDVVATLQGLNFLQYYRGQRIIHATKDAVDRHLQESCKGRVIEVDTGRLRWAPKEWPLPPHMQKGRSRGGNTVLSKPKGK
jgi:histone acetyltransferase MYST1